MTRRDGSEHDTARDDYEVLSGHELRYLRMRCLEIAERSMDPEAALATPELIGVAETLLHYVRDGVIPPVIVKISDDELQAAAGAD